MKTIKSISFLVSLLFLIFAELDNIVFSKRIIYVENGQFVDRVGRLNVFHGVNIDLNDQIIVKLPISESDISNNISEIDREFLIDNGFNSVRIGVSWSKHEEEKSNTENQYLSRLFRLIDYLGEKDIYSLISIKNVEPCINCNKCKKNVIPKAYVNLNNKQNPCDNSLVSKIFGLVGKCKNNGECEIQEEIYDQFYEDNIAIEGLSKFIESLLSKLYDHNYLLGIDVFDSPIIPMRTQFLSNIAGYYSSRKISNFYSSINEKLKFYMFDLGFQIPKSDTYKPFGFNSLYGKFVNSFKSKPGKNMNILMTSMDCNLFKDYSDENFISRCYHLVDLKTDILKESSKNNGVTTVVSEFGHKKLKAESYNEIDLIVKFSENKIFSWFYKYYKTLKSKDLNGYVLNGLLPNAELIQKLSRPYILAFQSKEVLSNNFYPEYRLFFSEFIADLSTPDGTLLFLSPKYYESKGFKFQLIYNNDKSKVLGENSEANMIEKSEGVIIEAQTTNRNDINIKLNNSVTTKELSDTALTYLNFNIVNDKYKNTRIDKLRVWTFLSPNIRYKYTIHHEERAKSFVKFNMKISDINKPFDYKTDRKIIFYFRNKNLKNSKSNTKINVSFDYKETDEFITSSFKELKENFKFENGKFIKECSYNVECFIELYYLPKANVMLYDDQKNLIEWEFQYILNHRILINFN